MALKVGIQLYSVRESLKKDPMDTLKKVAAAGFKYLETANHDITEHPGIGFPIPVQEMKKILDDLDMQVIGAHFSPISEDGIDATLDYLAELGVKQANCANIEWYPYQDMDYVMRRCDDYNKIGAVLKKHGMKSYYHNHYMEFQKFGPENKCIEDIIMENTDPELVFLELDTYWVTRGGQSAVEYIKKYKDRLLLLHQKDFPSQAPQPINMYDGVLNPASNLDRVVFGATKNPRCFTEIGTGILPIQDFIDAAGEAPNCQYIILEQDSTQLTEIESINRSMDAFHKFKGIEWA